MGTANLIARFSPPSHYHSLNEQEVQHTREAHGLSCSTFNPKLR
ncbi:hypothetical protein TNCT_695141, partial [Trichonephila clavata]